MAITLEREPVSQVYVNKNKWLDLLFLGQTPQDYFRSLFTKWNAIFAFILAVGLPLTYIRFTEGMGAVSNLTNDNPWGFWIGVDVAAGVALAAGGFTVGAAVFIFGKEKYHLVLRPAVLTGMLGYAFVVVGLCFDLGRPWRLPYPMFVSHGVTSVMFEVGWCVALYLTVQVLEFLPVGFEAAGWRKLRHWAVRITIGVTILGITLSTLHQSALGSLFLIAPSKVHPLWYSSYLPIYFFISAVIAGLTMVIFESTLSHKFFHEQINPANNADMHEITMGLGKAASVVLFVYFCLKWLGVAHQHAFGYLDSNFGHWFLVEMFGFVLLPCFLIGWAVRENLVKWVRIGAGIAVLGVVVNRVNVAIVAMNWNGPETYIPSWKEVWISLTVITLGVLTFRFIVNRAPVLRPHPDFIGEPDH